MPEERKVTASSRRLSEGAAQSGPERTAEKRRAKAIERMTLIGAVAAAAIIGSYVLLYFQTGAWQFLIGIAALALSITCMASARRLARRGKIDAAGYWILSALVIVYGVGELIWSDATLLLIVSFTLLTIIAISVVQPRRWTVWLVTAVLYLIYIFLVNQLEPLPRHAILESSPATQFTNIPLALLVLWQVIRAFHTGTIRVRLLIAFVLVVLVPITTILFAQVVAGFRAGQQRATAQLESVATLKEAAIETWLATLQTDLAAVLTEEDAAQNALVLLQKPSFSESYQAAYSKLQSRLLQPIEHTQRFERLFLMDQRGRVIISTDTAQEGNSYLGFTFFQLGLDGPKTHLTKDEGQWWIDSVRPITDERGQVVGVLAGRTNLETLGEIMLVRTGLGNTGETYLLSAERGVVTELRAEERVTRMSPDGAYAAIVKERVDGSDTYDNYYGVPVVGVYHWIPELRVALLAEQERVEALLPTYITLIITGGIALIATVGAIIVSFFIARSIATPLADLAETATQIATGDLERMAKVKREDEIGSLAQAFNSMTGQLRNLVGSLEQRVTDRTRELEQRSAYLETSAEVGRAVSSILDADLLIRQVVELIRERFDLYYVGLFLTDQAGEWAVLQAGTGEAGRAMLARGHRLKIGLEGMIGWSIANAQARIALYAEEDIVRTVTAELPDTRSEAALPLRSRDRVLGALTIQHDQPDAFDDDTIAVLQTMADQVAVALDNARLFTESQAALEATRRVYSELRREAWGELLRAQPDLGYRSHAGGVTPAGDVWRTDMEQALLEGKTIQSNGSDAEEKFPLAVPIKVRDDVIGVLDTYKPAGAGEWTTEEISLLETLAEQLGEALESARLYQDTQLRAARERLTREITDRMRAATSVEGIVQAAVDELFSVMKTSRTFVRLGTVTERQGDKETR